MAEVAWYILVSIVTISHVVDNTKIMIVTTVPHQPPNDSDYYYAKQAELSTNNCINISFIFVGY